MSTVTASLLAFRTAYLKTVAQSWRDGNFYKKLFGCYPEWHNCKEGKKRNPDEHCNPTDTNTDLLSFLGERGYFYSPWQYVSIALTRENRVHYNPVNGTNWVGKNDLITITLPNRPLHPAFYAEALMEYYRHFPTIMGKELITPELVNLTYRDLQNTLSDNIDLTDLNFKQFIQAINNGDFKRKEPQLERNPPIKTENLKEPNTDETGGSYGTNFDLGIHNGIFEQFGAMVIQAVDLSWSNKFFREELIEAKSDGFAVLSKFLGLHNPFNFDIQFVKDKPYLTDSTEDAQKSESEKPIFEFEVYNHELRLKIHHKQNRKPNKITLWYPEPPMEKLAKSQHNISVTNPFLNGSKVSRAISAYNTNGAAYPFSSS